MQTHDIFAVAPAADTMKGVIQTRDGVRLAYKDFGAGKPVVLVHSWALSAGMWDYQIPFLVDHGCRCIAYDRRGHGQSSDPGRGYDFDTFADDLAAVLEAPDLSDVTLIGHSMGGGEITRYLTRHGRARIAKIVLLASTIPFPLKTSDNPEGIEGTLIDAMRAAWRHDYPQWLADNTAPFFTPETSEPMRTWIIRMAMQSSLQTLIACNESVVETDFRAELLGITTPTLIIHGDKDVSTPLPITGAKTAALIPGSRLLVYEGAPHGLFITHKDRLNADILAFLRE
jgi:non-heme chloroperoxidase